MVPSEAGTGALRSLSERGKLISPAPLIVITASSNELGLLLNFAERCDN